MLNPNIEKKKKIFSSVYADMLYLLVHSSFCLSLGCTLLHTGTRAAAPASHRNVSILRCQRNTV